MIDYSTPYLALNKLMKDFHAATIKGEYAKAYEIAVDITDVSQQLEDIAKGLVRAYSDWIKPGRNTNGRPGRVPTHRAMYSERF